MSAKGDGFLEKEITLITPSLPAKPRLKRVAAYTRVSSDKDAMLHSLSNQVSYYSALIQGHPGWQYCGVFSDEGLTGTKDNRPGFQSMINTCRAGKLDLVITKSISRFARNTVTLLETVRELKALNVEIFFEEQGIYTLSSDGELMMTILASYAQEESRSVSENQKWRIRKNFEEGKPWTGFMLGYRYKDGQLVVVPDEAETVRRIFREYLAGYGYQRICNDLNDDGVRTRDGFPWSAATLMKILKNYNYTGNLLLQRKYRENHITKRTLVNRGERDMFHAQETHEAIVSEQTYYAVQEEMAKRAEKYGPHNKCSSSFSPFTHRIKCGCCSSFYNRKTTQGKKIWICRTYNTIGKSGCPDSRAIPEQILYSVVCEALGLEEFDALVFEESVDHIVSGSNNQLDILFSDGSIQNYIWEPPSRSKSWTPEMRAAAREAALRNLRRDR